MPIEVVSLRGQLFRFEGSNVGVYDGTFSSDDTEITGGLKQEPTALPVTFKRTDKVPTLSRLKDPEKPYPYVEEGVS